LLAPNRYTLEYVQANLVPQIEEILQTIDSSIRRVRVEIGGHESPGKAGNGAARGRAGAMRPYAGSVMDANNIFDKHVEGDSNQMARAAALQVGKHPGRADGSNPLFISGGVGLGKTHLMQAAGHLMLKDNPDAKIFYLNTESFVNDMVESIQKNAMAKFRRHYRALDALLVDDIHFFARKEKSQVEFFNTFNALYAANKQIILASDRSPDEIANIELRLISRFNGGLTVSIDPPELETRAAIVVKKALERGAKLPTDVALFIAGAVRSNVRDLEGALHTVLAVAGFKNCLADIDVDFAREVLRDRLAHRDRLNSIENIQRSVAEHYKLRVSDLLSKRRSRDITRPRQLAMYFAKEYTDASLSKIGDRFGGRDHTTVLHAHKKITELLQTDEAIRQDHRNLQRLFGD
ncbi:MAG: chromosomal replication initiator protein DnaA, partial [Gammaproteobacteria bacterium]